MWRNKGSIYYHPDIRTAPNAPPSSSALAPKVSEQPLATQAALLLPEVPKVSNQAGDQGHKAEGAQDKNKGKEKKPLAGAKDVAQVKDDEAKTKEAEAKLKESNPKAKDAATSNPSQKEDALAPKAKA